MNDIMWFFLGGLFGFLISHKKNSSIVDEVLQDRVKDLEEKVKYYKDLCKWHVEEKRKAQEIRDKFERESG